MKAKIAALQCATLIRSVARAWGLLAKARYSTKPIVEREEL